MTLDPKFVGRDKTAVGARLELTRHAFGLDQQAFAARANLKASTYNQYERGVNYPQLAAALALKDAFGLSLDWIYDGDPSALSYRLHEAIVAASGLRGYDA